jgi:hypothetical protein
MSGQTHSTSRYCRFSDGSHFSLPLFLFEITLRADWLPWLLALESCARKFSNAPIFSIAWSSRACPLCARRGIHRVHFSGLFLIKRMSPANDFTYREKGCLCRKAHIGTIIATMRPRSRALTEQLEGAKQCSGRITGNPEVIPRTACEVGLSLIPRRRAKGRQVIDNPVSRLLEAVAYWRRHSAWV